jgi:hypothetical protein
MGVPSGYTSAQVVQAVPIPSGILQVVASTTTTNVTNSTNVLADTTLTATITPTSATSQILVCVTHSISKSAGNAGNGVVLNVLRGATDIGQLVGAHLLTSTTLLQIGTVAGNLLDSPATTSATTYKTQFKNLINAASVSVNNNSSTGTMILLEVSA